MNKAHIGSDFDDFLKAEGLLAECETVARQRVWAVLEGKQEPVSTESEQN